VKCYKWYQVSVNELQEVSERMSATPTNLVAEARLVRLAERLERSGSITISDAAVELDVSEMTIRRDLAELEERGIARRVRGGALPLGPQTFAERRQSRSRAKGQIAAKLARLIPTTGTIAFDASSTVMRAAAALSGARDLTVLTNGPDTFHALQGRVGVSPLLTGGVLEPRTRSLVGALAGWTARQLITSRFIMSCAAIDTAVGATERVLEEAEVKRALADGADEIVIAVDSSKLERRAMVVCLDWSAIDLLVTELDPSDHRLDPYRAVVTLV
jgi:DeoR family transcriptional regulator, fructose operon transcriptional repressor